MKWKNIQRMMIISVFLGSLMVSGYCQTDDYLPVASLKEMRCHEYVVAMNSWMPVDQNLVCLVTSVPSQEIQSSLPRKMTIVEESDETLTPMFEFETADSFITMYLVNNHILSIWGTGTAFIIRVFSFTDNTVKMSLEKGTRLSPEILDIDNDGQDELLITNGHFLFSGGENKIIQYPDTTDIYKWDGESYQLLKTVPWETRFKSL